MNQTIAMVVDTSVAIKLLLAEEHTGSAERLYEEASLAGTRLVAPSLIRAEVANAVYQRYRRGDLTSSDADATLERFARLGIDIAQDSDLHRHAVIFARQHRLPAVYDSHFIVLARALGATMWTGDQRLLRHLAGAAPWVRWIGDYPLDAANAR